MRNLAFIIFSFISSVAAAQFSYIHPMPGTINHNRETGIILKNGKWIDKESVKNHDLVEITGSKSGLHKWSARLSDDRKTVIIRPIDIFSYDEKVTVTVHPELKNTLGERITGTTFSFNIRKKKTAFELERSRQARREIFKEEYGYYPDESTYRGPVRGPDTTITYPLDSMPAYTINVNDNPWDGQIFFNNHEDQTGPDPFTNSFTTIIENDGTIIWARDVGKEGHDFKINANGYLTYFITKREMWLIMDSNYSIIDSVQCKNGYEESTNEHDMMIYPDGHVFLIAYDNETTDMTAFGGQSNATVQYCVLQELDSSRDVIFEWRSQDPGHYLFTDANQFTSLANSTVDYVHCNSIIRDNDGNIIISCRNMDEVTKINAQTGAIIWRLGGEKNQFTFINDNNVKHFASQHDAQRIENGNLTLFNNANHMSPQRSSAKEYALNEINKTATLVWYYEHPDVNGIKVYGSATGNAQRLPNGNTMIDWGLIPWGTGVPNQTEVDSLGNIRWEMTWDSVGQKSYRVHKYQWDPCSRPTSGLIKVKKILSTSVKVDWEPATGAVSYDVQYRQIGNVSWKIKNTTLSEKKLKGLKPDSVYVFQVRTHCDNGVSGWTLMDTFQTAPLRLYQPEEATPAFSVFPNPVTNVLQMVFNSARDQDVILEVRDISGKAVHVQTVPVNEGNVLLPLNVNAFPDGIYIIEIQTGSERLIQKFVKQ